MEQPIMYRYSRMELDQFAVFEENYRPGITEVQFQTVAQFSFDTEHSVLCSIIIVSMYDQEKLLMKAELKSYFELQAESVESLRQEGRIQFTPAHLVQFASLCYGSMRGVLHMKTMHTPLNDFVLPPVYFNNIIDKGFVVEGSY